MCYITLCIRNQKVQFADPGFDLHEYSYLAFCQVDVFPLCEFAGLAASFF